MILAFSGTRYLFPFQERAITRYLERIKHAGKVQCVMTGACIGVDSFIAQWISENAQEIKNVILLPSRRDYVNMEVVNELKQKGALVRSLEPPANNRNVYAARNQQLVDESDGLVAFWDGKSRGTKMTIDMAKRAGKLIETIRI